MSRRFMPWFGQAAFAVALAGAASAAPAQHSQGLVLDDAERFALLLQSHDLPTASQLQSAYLDPGSAGVRIFTPHRIRDATTLAEAVAKDPEAYRRALHLCLPVAQRLQAEATDIAHRISALLGSSGPVPVYVVLGAGNSGGTASAQGLVLGLEVICRQATDASAAHQLLKDFIAHELVHVHQLRAGTEQSSSDLLRQSLVEGFADHVMELVVGPRAVSDRARQAYGLAHEPQLWREFSAAMDKRQGLAGWLYGPATQAGRPADMGYWIGKRICQAYMAHPVRAATPAQSLQTLLLLRDPIAILRDSAYEQLNQR